MFKRDRDKREADRQIDWMFKKQDILTGLRDRQRDIQERQTERHTNRLDV